MTIRTIILALTALLASHVAAQTTISLRASVALPPGGTLHLADIADIEGPDASSLLNAIITPGADATVDLDAVRKAAAGVAGINPGRLLFSGFACKLGPVEAAPVSQPPIAGEPEAPVLTEGVVRGAVLTRLSEVLAVPAKEMRTTFDKRDESLLGMSCKGRSVVVNPTGAGDKPTFSVRVYEHDSLVNQGTIRVGVLIRRDVAVATVPISKGETLANENIVVDEQWLPPSVRPATGVVGRVAHSRIGAGEVIAENDVETARAVRKGDLVNIDCVSGGIAVRTTARALSDGKQGDTILFETIRWNTQIAARISGPGVAVSVPGLTEQPDKQSGRKPRRGE
ncbi:MAG: flagellar basal body P-ring formation protein FlgA [Planctomycetes bacterium]|nr:flagellar basal body P-ring formation protein FlgA [Planctomycetota bacterium]